MKTIAKPTIKVKDVFLQCISTVDNLTLKQNLTNCVNVLETAETDFENKFGQHQIYQIAQNLVVLAPIGKKEMKTVYDYRMVKTPLGRVYYNQLMSAAQYGKCPLCSVREVDALDHYLPKSKYPVYSVTPINLVPACTPCNIGKRIDYPSTSEEQTLHPYYDNVENVSWIIATVLQTNPISFEYSVAVPNGWTQILKDRAKNHFESFHLNELFSTHANEELRGAKKQLEKLYNYDPNLMKAHLQECYNSRLELGVNSWQAVMYNTLLNDIWFCSGGVLT